LIVNSPSFDFTADRLLLQKLPGGKKKQLLFVSRAVTDLSIPKEVSVIADFACHQARYLKSIKFWRIVGNNPEGPVEIGSYAFASSGLTELEVPITLKTIGPFAFSNCEALEDVRFATWKDASKGFGIQEIGRRAFSFSAVDYFEPPETLQSIGEGAFAGSALERIRIPSGVHRLRRDTFAGCAALEYAVYSGDVNLEIEAGAFPATKTWKLVVSSAVNRRGLEDSPQVVVAASKDELDAIATRLTRLEPPAPASLQYEDLEKSPEDYGTNVEGIQGGGGGFGVTTVLRNARTKRHCICKSFIDTVGNQDEATIKEIQVLAFLRHPAITGIIGYFPKGQPHLQRAILMEYCENGDVRSALQVPGSRPYAAISDGSKNARTLKAKIIVGMALAMRHMHKYGLWHLDLKPGNLFLDRNFEVRLGDFGTAKIAATAEPVAVKAGQAEAEDKNKDADAGTIKYESPERLHKGTITPREDVYAFAISVWEIITGKEAFAGLTAVQLTEMVQVKHGELRPELDPNELTQTAITLCSHCWGDDISLRPDFDSIVETYIKGRGYDLIFDIDKDEVRDYCERIEKVERQWNTEKLLQAQARQREAEKHLPPGEQPKPLTTTPEPFRIIEDWRIKPAKPANP
jgi:serine/threonine protein kinase